MPASVSQLTSGIASGNADVFASFFRDRFAEMFAEARRTTGCDESFCMDVVQDAMIRVIKSMRPMDTEAALRTWLRIVVQSCAYDRLRAELRRRRWQASRPVQTEASTCDLEAKRDWLRRELASLDGPSAYLLTLRYRFGWTLEKIAATLGMKTGAVDGRISRTLARLRRRAEETFDD